MNLQLVSIDSRLAQKRKGFLCGLFIRDFIHIFSNLSEKD